MITPIINFSFSNNISFSARSPKASQNNIMGIRKFCEYTKIDEKNMRKALKNNELEMIGKKVNITAKKTKAFVEKFFRLVSIKKFTEITGIQRKAVEKSIKLGELELIDKKIDTEAAKTKEYIEFRKNLVSMKKLSEMTGVGLEAIERGVRAGEIETYGKRIVYLSPITQNFIKTRKEIYQEQLRRQTDPTHLDKKTLAKQLGVTIKTLKSLIKKGYITPNQDGSIDITTEPNKEFSENYIRYNAERYTRYSSNKYDKLQARLGKIPVEYCIKNGLLVAEEDGTIITQKEPNKSFLEKIDKKEITHRTYFVTITTLMEKFGISRDKLSKAISEGKLIREKGLGIDLNNETNKSFITKNATK